MIKIFATSATTGERFQISDLYWFEENGVQDWNGQGHDDKFTFEIYLEEPQKTPNWKPIDTAPKDGRRILIAYYDGIVGDTANKPRIMVGFARWDAQLYNDRPRPYWEYEGSRRVTWCREQVAIAWDEPPTPPTIECGNVKPLIRPSSSSNGEGLHPNRKDDR